MSSQVLITGSLGQIGSELTPILEKKFGLENVIKVDTNYPSSDFFEYPIDVCNYESLEKLFKRYKIQEIYHLAAILSAKGEKDPNLAWQVNLHGLKNILELAHTYNTKVFWPSSIAVFGPTTPQDQTHQFAHASPTTMYGVTKLTGELLCQYYHKKHNVDVRSLRFPGLISHETLPNGGTTDYAVEIFHEVIKKGSYECFISKDTPLPMMYMPDALKAVFKLMEADPQKINIRTSYNLAAVTFTPSQLAAEIKKHLDFDILYNPDFRQEIADSWPNSIDDSYARTDWGWEHDYSLTEMVQDMISQIKAKLNA